jgi:hypothetical protein
MAQPDADGCELDGCEEVVVSFVMARCHGLELFEFAEEALDEVAVAIEEGADDGAALAISHRLDVGPDTTLGQLGPERVTIVSAIGEQDVTITQSVQHVGSAAPIVRLTGSELERDLQAVGVDQRVDLGRQAAARTIYGTGFPFLCRWRYVDEPGWKNCRSSAHRPRKPLTASNIRCQ